MSNYGLRIIANGTTWAGDCIGKFIIYGDGKKLFERDDLTAFEMKPGKNGIETLNEIYCGSPVTIRLNGEIKTARKENLLRKDNYALTYTPEYFRNERRIALYIHVSEIAVDDLGEVLAMKTADEKCYLHAVRLRFLLPVTFKRLHSEYIQCDGSWKIPDNGRWADGWGPEDRPCYRIYDYTDSRLERAREKGKGVIKSWYTFETVENASFLSAFRYYSRIDYSEDRQRRCRIAEKLKAAGIRDFSFYDVEKLEKALGIILEG